MNRLYGWAVSPEMIIPVIPTYLASNVEPDTLHRLFVDKQVQTVILKPTDG